MLFFPMNVNGFLSLNTWIYKAFYYYSEWFMYCYYKWPPLAIIGYSVSMRLSLCSADLPYTIFNVLHLIFIINYCFYLLMHIHSNALLLLLLILPTQNNKSVKALFTHDVQKNIVLGVWSHGWVYSTDWPMTYGPG